MKIKSGTEIKTTFKSDGKIGVGTDAPNELLDVMGSLYVNNQVKMNSTDEDKILLNGQNSQSKISLANNGNSVRYFAGSQDTVESTGSHEFLTSDGQGSQNWIEKMSLKRINNNNYMMLHKDSTIWASQNNDYSGSLTLQAGYSNNNLEEDTNMSSVVINGNNSSNGIVLRTKKSDRVVIDRDSGNVGVGTNAPEAPLHVKTGSGIDSTFDGVGILVEQSDNTKHSIIDVNVASGGTGNPLVRLGIDNGSVWSTGIDKSDESKLKIANSDDLQNNTKVTIKADGNVGIGVTDPTKKLDVNGDIHAINLVLDGSLTSNSTTEMEDTLTLKKLDGIGLDVKGNVLIAGTNTTSGLTNLNGGIKVNDTNFIVDSTGNTTIKTSLDVAEGAFTVQSTSGNDQKTSY